MRELKPIRRYSQTGETSIQFLAHDADKMKAYCVGCGFYHLLTVPGKEMETYDAAKKMIDDLDRIYYRGGWILERTTTPTGSIGAWQEETAQEYARTNNGEIYEIYREDDNGEIQYIEFIYPQGLRCVGCNAELVAPWSNDEATIIIDGEPYEGKTVYADGNGYYWYDDTDTIERLDHDEDEDVYFLA